MKYQIKKLRSVGNIDFNQNPTKPMSDTITNIKKNKLSELRNFIDKYIYKYGIITYG